MLTTNIDFQDGNSNKELSFEYFRLHLWKCFYLVLIPEHLVLLDRIFLVGKFFSFNTNFICCTQKRERKREKHGERERDKRETETERHPGSYIMQTNFHVDNISGQRGIIENIKSGSLLL